VVPLVLQVHQVPRRLADIRLVPKSNHQRYHVNM
jgi:hypothetical protein